MIVQDCGVNLEIFVKICKKLTFDPLWSPVHMLPPV